MRENISERVLASKMISGEALGNPGIRQALEADFAAATALRHDNMCRLHRLHSGRNIYIITEYFWGLGIADFRRAARPHRLHIVDGNLNFK